MKIEILFSWKRRSTFHIDNFVFIIKIETILSKQTIAKRNFRYEISSGNNTVNDLFVNENFSVKQYHRFYLFNAFPVTNIQQRRK